MKQRRILVILPRIPMPARDGAEVVMSEFLQGLSSRGIEVDIFSLNPSRQHREPETLTSWGRVTAAASVDTRIRPFRLLLELLFPRNVSLRDHHVSTSYWLSRFISIDVLSALRDFVGRNGPYDIIHCETLFTVYYGMALRDQMPQTAVIYRSHNVEWLIQDRLSKESSASIINRVVRRRLATQTRAYEEFVAKSVDAIGCISSSDEQWYRSTMTAAHTVTVHPGIAAETQVQSTPSGTSLGFLGSLDWEPNRIGLTWFIENVYPTIQRSMPDVQFHIAGRGSERFVSTLSLPGGITCHGEVASVRDFYSSIGVLVAPLFSGSGIRIKLLEAFALGKAVVTTPQGAEGIDAYHNVHCAIAQSGEEFAGNCLRLLNDPEQCKHLAENARRLAQETYSHDASMDSVLKLYQAALEGL